LFTNRYGLRFNRVGIGFPFDRGIERLTILRRSVLLVAVAFLLWRICVSGMSSYYAELLDGDEADAVDKALAWDNRQPEALYRQAIALRHQDPKRACPPRAGLRAESDGPASADGSRRNCAFHG